jgi:hypothetical protein
MTSLLRRKRPITVRVPNTAARTAYSLFVLLLSGAAFAQTPSPSPYAAWPPPPAPFGTPRGMGQESPPRAMYVQQRIPGAPLAPGERIASPEQGLDLLQSAPYTIQLEPPGLEKLAGALQSDEQLQERIRQENRERKTPERIVFPPDPVLSREIYRGRKWEPKKLEVAPYYVCYGRLRFEEKNAERYGWDLGILQPLVTEAYFLKDVVMLPYHLATQPCRCFEYNTGYCLPGDPVPYLLYPPSISATGTVAEVGTILALVAIFP